MKWKKSHLTVVLVLGICASAFAAAPASQPVDRINWLAREQGGALAEVNGARVCFLSGSPPDMGRQHGKLLALAARDNTKRVLEFARSHGDASARFGGGIEQVALRTSPFIPAAYKGEMRALALASGIDEQDVIAANLFPELFHCSGFALSGHMTVDGELLHGRNLDYKTDLGLQRNAVVFICRPEHGHAFVNVGYAGFIGCVTGMNDQSISLGEMGGDGFAQDWDGLPMSMLMRQAAERAHSLSSTIDVFRNTPRTCHYYYVVADGKKRDAVALNCMPKEMDVIGMGQKYKELPEAVPDTVLISGDDRYSHLVERVREKTGQFTPELGQWLMTQPVAMSCSLHCVLFRPISLDVWFADAADPQTNPRFQACWQPYHHLNLKALLKDYASSVSEDIHSSAESVVR